MYKYSDSKSNAFTIVSGALVCLGLYLGAVISAQNRRN